MAELRFMHSRLCETRWLSHAKYEIRNFIIKIVELFDNKFSFTIKISLNRKIKNHVHIR